MRKSVSSGLITAAVLTMTLGACGSNKSVYFAEVDGRFVELTKAEYDAYQTGAPVSPSAQARTPAPRPGAGGATLDPDGVMAAAILRNPTAQRSTRILGYDASGKPPSNEEIADVSLEIALDLCNIPEGTRLSAETPCNL